MRSDKIIAHSLKIAEFIEFFKDLRDEMYLYKENIFYKIAKIGCTLSNFR